MRKKLKSVRNMYYYKDYSVIRLKNYKYMTNVKYEFIIHIMYKVKETTSGI